MKKLMVVLVAALGCAAFAEPVEGGKCAAEGDKCAVEGGKCPAEIGKGPGAGPRFGKGMHEGMMKDPIVRIATRPDAAEKFSISEEQQAKLKELGKARGNGEAQKKMREAMQKQATLMSADQVDEAALMAAIDEVFALRCQMAKDQAKRVIAVKSILTPEQVQKIHEEMKKSFAPRGERGPRERGPRGKGPRHNGPGADKDAPKPEAK